MQGEILWVHEVRVQVVTAISGLYHNMLDLFIFGTELYFQEALDAESLFVFVPSTI